MFQMIVHKFWILKCFSVNFFSAIINGIKYSLWLLLKKPLLVFMASGFMVLDCSYLSCL